MMRKKCKICFENDNIKNLKCVEYKYGFEKYYIFYHEDCLKNVLKKPRGFENYEIETAIEIANLIKEERTKRYNLVMDAFKKYKDIFDNNNIKI